MKFIRIENQGSRLAIFRLTSGHERSFNARELLERLNNRKDASFDVSVESAALAELENPATPESAATCETG